MLYYDITQATLFYRGNAAKSDLIDLLDDPSSPSGQQTNPTDELAELFGSSSAAASQPLSFNGSHSTRSGNASSSSNLVGLAPGFGGIMLPGTPQPQAQPIQSPNSQFPLQAPSYAPSIPPALSASTALGGTTAQQMQRQNNSTQPKSSDPFADLAGLF